MKQLTCEMCGSIDLVKQDGYFVCQFCGCKYTVEEAKKMMIEGTVEVQGTVKVDVSDELKNLYQIARRAKDDNNSEKAAKYYDMIVVKDPESWEANFYSVYYQSMNCKIMNITNAAIRLSNCEDTVLKLIRDNVESAEERKKAVCEVGRKLISISSMLFEAARNHYNGIGSSIRANYVQEFLNRGCSARDIVYYYGDYVVQYFGDLDVKDVVVACWKEGIAQHLVMMPFFAKKEENKNIIVSYGDKIKKYEPTYQTPEVKTSSGCYVATCVYGSYDCPQVWTLRRYRDETLGSTWYGRAFIKLYYAVSPTLVKWFGKTKWFKKMWKGTLDRMVSKLQDKGVESTPYQDKEWKK